MESQGRVNVNADWTDRGGSRKQQINENGHEPDPRSRTSPPEGSSDWHKVYNARF
jgi:hypothetical protein